MTLRFVCLLTLLTLCACAALAAPTVFWASDPVRPGETVVAVGDGLDRCTLKITRVPDNAPPAPASLDLVATGRGVPPIQAATGSVKFVVPADMPPGLFAFSVATPDGMTTRVLNQPEVWWVQGEGTGAMVAGGTLRVFGKNLANTVGRPIAIELTGTRTVRLPATGDGFALKATLPADLPEGAYYARVLAGWGGSYGRSEGLPVEVARPSPWPTQVFNVHDFGAEGKGQTDDTEAVKAALVAAAKSGGGTVFFPRGRYEVTDSLEIPRFVTLKGEGRELVNIFWPDVQNPPAQQLKATNSFAIEDLTFYCANYSRFLVAEGTEPTAGNIRLRRLTVRANRYRGHIEASEADRRLKSGSGNQCPLLTFGGPAVEVTDCDLYSSGMAFWLTRLRGAYIARNIFSNGRWGWYSLSGNDGVIFENNRIVGGDLMATGGGLNTLDGSSYSQHVFYAHNTLLNMFGWDREAMTSDAGGGAYFGKALSALDKVVTLAENTKLQGRDWKGAGLYILDGKGAGQYRRVVSATQRDVTVDSPWQVPPDATSTVTLCAFQGRCLFVDNDFTDAGLALQLYGNAIEHILVNNRSARTAGYHNFGMIYSDGIQPNWYIQWLDNRITEGNVYWGDHDNHRLSGEAHIGVYAFPPKADWECPLTLGTIIRRSVLDNNAHIMLGCEWGTALDRTGRYVRDVLVEGNTVSHSDMGVFAYATADGVVLRNNRFVDVKSPLGGPGLGKAFVPPTERANAIRVSLQSLTGELGVKQDITQLPEVAATLDALAKLPNGSPEEPRLRTKALRLALAQVAKAQPDGFPLTALSETLGLTVRMPWESPSHVDLQNRPTGGPSRLDLIVSTTMPLGEALPVSAEAKVPDGWTSKPSDSADLTDKTPATLGIPLTIPPGEWGGHDFPVTLNVGLGAETLRLHTTIMSGSGFVRKWMLLGPFPNKTGKPLDLSLEPPEDGIDLGGEYDGVTGKIRWQPWEDGDWINFKDMYKLDKPGVVYAVACVNSPKDMAAEVRLGCSSGVALTVNGEPIWSSDRVDRRGPSGQRAPIHLKAGDNVIMLKLCGADDAWTVVCELGPAPKGEPLTGVTVVSPTQFKGRACFTPPPPRPMGEVGEIKYPAGVTWKLVQADDFDRDTLGARWRIGGGTWKVGGGMVQASGEGFVGLSYAEPLAAPVRIEYDCRVTGDTGGDLSVSWLASPGEYTSGYLIGFGSNGNTINKLMLGNDQLTQSAGPLVQPGKWHHVIAQILKNGRVQQIVDGQLSLDFQGKDPGESKFAGLWVWGRDGLFRKVRIYRGG